MYANADSAHKSAEDKVKCLCESQKAYNYVAKETILSSKIHAPHFLDSRMIFIWLRLKEKNCYGSGSGFCFDLKT
jgi:hypothetical protein